MLKFVIIIGRVQSYLFSGTSAPYNLQDFGDFGSVGVGVHSPAALEF